MILIIENKINYIYTYTDTQKKKNYIYTYTDTNKKNKLHLYIYRHKQIKMNYYQLAI